MIEINLLPGTGKKKASRGGGGGPKFDLAASLGGLSKKVKDKYLAAAVLGVIVSAGAMGFLYTTQSQRQEELQGRLDQALADSTHFAAVVDDQLKMTAKRDTLLHDLNLIRSIDEDRFVWAHALDEISRALPQYTWLSSLTMSGSPQGASANPAPTAGKKEKEKKKDKSKIETEIPRDTVRFRLVGQTVDIQALTRFMRQLESSPFLQDVQLEKSELALADGKEVTQFTLNATYSRPDTSTLNRVPLSVSVR